MLRSRLERGSDGSRERRSGVEMSRVRPTANRGGREVGGTEPGRRGGEGTRNLTAVPGALCCWAASGRSCPGGTFCFAPLWRMGEGGERRREEQWLEARRAGREEGGRATILPEQAGVGVDITQSPV